MTAEPVTFKITVPHNPDIRWHEWFFPNGGWWNIGPTECRDRGGNLQGKREGYYPEWFVLMCNNTECGARAVVPVSLITDHADALDPEVDR